MAFRIKNETGLLCAYKPCLRVPRTAEMTFIVRGRYRLEPGAPLTLTRTDAISEELVEKTRQDNEEAADKLEETAVTLGQGSITGDEFDESDADRVGQLLYPNDFADYKLKADVLLKGTCYPPSRHDTSCDVTFRVGGWEKSLRVEGHRVWVDRTAGGEHTKAKPIGTVAVDYNHAYGGPGFPNNPVGKGHATELEGDGDDLYQPPRSERSAVMPSQQLPNIVFPDGKPHKDGLAAGLGPLSPNWPFRTEKLGKKYDDKWLATRAPWFAEDMDGSYFNAAPPDQQVDFLRGDEELSFTHLHPRKRRFSVSLPGHRVRAFVRDDEGQSREVAMRLDTLFADLDEGVLYLTWRGITPVREEDLTDVAFGLVATEPLAEKARPAKDYIAELAAFAADPVGLQDVFPEGFQAFADNAKKLEDASDDELDALLEDEEHRPPAALMKNVLGPMAPDGLADLDRSWDEAVKQEKVDEAAMKKQLADGIKKGMRGGGGDGGAVGLRLPVRDGEAPVFPIGVLVRAQERRLVEMKKGLPEDTDPAVFTQIDASLEKLRNNPELRAVDPHYQPYREDDPPPDEPGPGADLLGRDLSDLDLSGRDLSGADIQCAILSRTNLRGANLTGAKLGGARLNRVDLSEANLTDVDLTSASFDRVNATGANLSRTRLDMFRASKSDFSEASFHGSEGMLATLHESTFARAEFGEVELMLCSFDACKLPGARFHGAKLEHLRFDTCEAPTLSLDGAHLSGTSFNVCELREATAHGAKGEGAIFFKSGLQKVSFRKADLNASHFYGVNALKADFSRANLPQARFDRAILRQADFQRANLHGADLRQTVLSKTSFAKASLYDAQLTLAAGQDVDLSGANTKGMNVQRSKLSTTGGGTP